MHRYYVLSIAVSRAAHLAIETQHFPLQDSKQTQDIRSKADVTEPSSLRTKREELACTYGVKHMSTPSPQSAPSPLPCYIRRKSLSSHKLKFLN